MSLRVHSCKLFLLCLLNPLTSQYGEMDEYLRECGFKSISVYSNYQKEPAVNDQCEMFLYECGQTL